MPLTCQISKAISPGAKLKKKHFKWDNWSVKGPTKNLYIWNTQKKVVPHTRLSYHTDMVATSCFELGP